MQLVSYLEEGPLIWIILLHLQVNKKPDNDDDDDDDDDDNDDGFYMGNICVKYF